MGIYRGFLEICVLWELKPRPFLLNLGVGLAQIPKFRRIAVTAREVRDAQADEEVVPCRKSRLRPIQKRSR